MISYTCGSSRIQLRGKGSFPTLNFPDTVKGWQSTWFYCNDVSVGEGQSGLPPYSTERIRRLPKLTVSKEKKVDVDLLVIALVALVNQGVNGLDLMEVFFQRRI